MGSPGPFTAYLEGIGGIRFSDWNGFMSPCGVPQPALPRSCLRKSRTTTTNYWQSLKAGVRRQQKPVGFSSPPTAAAAATPVKPTQSVLCGRLAGPGLG